MQILQTLCLLPLKLGERYIQPLWGFQVRTYMFMFIHPSISLSLSLFIFHFTSVICSLSLIRDPALCHDVWKTTACDGGFTLGALIAKRSGKNVNVTCFFPVGSSSESSACLLSIFPEVVVVAETDTECLREAPGGRVAEEEEEEEWG